MKLKRYPLIQYEFMFICILGVSISLFFDLQRFFSAIENQEIIESIRFTVFYIKVTTTHHSYQFFNNPAIFAFLTLLVNLAKPMYETLRLAWKKWRNLEN